MIRYAIEDRVATITVERPEVRNALGPAEWQAIARHVEEARRDEAVRVLVVTGAGGCFSAGGDVKSMPERLAMAPAARRAQLLDDMQVIRALRELPKPIVAAIDGPCVGAGLSLALACDLRLATRRAKLGAVFHAIGLTGDFGLTWLLPRVVGPARAMELVMGAEIVDAERALAIGLVSRLVDPEQLEGETRALAARLAAGPPVAQALSKAGLQRALESDLASQLEWEAQAQAICSRTDDVREGLAALAEKRPPRFLGK